MHTPDLNIIIIIMSVAFLLWSYQQHTSLLADMFLDLFEHRCRWSLNNYHWKEANIAAGELLWRNFATSGQILFAFVMTCVVFSTALYCSFDKWQYLYVHFVSPGVGRCKMVPPPPATMEALDRLTPQIPYWMMAETLLLQVSWPFIWLGYENNATKSHLVWESCMKESHLWLFSSKKVISKASQ